MGLRNVKLTLSAWRRVAEVSRYVEQQPRNVIPGLTRAVDFGGAVEFIVTTALPRMSGPSPGVGAGKMQKLVSGSFVDDSETIYPVMNVTTSLIAVGSRVLCLPGYGLWTVVNIDMCSNLS